MGLLWVVIPSLLAVGTVVIAYFQLRRPVSHIVIDERWALNCDREKRTMIAEGRVIITTMASGVIRKEATCKVKWRKTTVELTLTKWNQHLLHANTWVAEFAAQDMADVPDSGQEIRLEVFVRLEDGARERMKGKLTFEPASQS